MGAKKWKFLTEEMLHYIDEMCDEMLAGQSENTIKQHKNVVKRTYEKLRHDPRNLFDETPTDLAEIFNNAIRATKIPTEAHIQASAHKITQFYAAVNEQIKEEQKSNAQKELEKFLATDEGQKAMLDVFKSKVKSNNPSTTKEELDSLVLPIVLPTKKKRKIDEIVPVKESDIDDDFDHDDDDDDEGSDEEAVKTFNETIVKKHKK